MVRRVDDTKIRPIEPASQPKVEQSVTPPVGSETGFIRGTKGISGPAVSINASRFGDPVTNFMAKFAGMPLAEQSKELTSIVQQVYRDNPRR